MSKTSISIAMAYVGVLVGAGLSSGQDLLQYFLCFGKWGLLGVVALGILNVIFGRIIIGLGSHFQSNNHQDVLHRIAHPVLTKIIDWALVISCFVVGFVMVAGAGANLQQEFGLPSYLGALICSALVLMTAFLDFDKITGVLGVFTPIIIGMIFIITAYTFIGHSYDFDALAKEAQTIRPAIPSLWVSVLNYFSICIMSGVSMAFVLGGSVVKIGDAEKGGMLGGAIIGVIITCVALTLFSHMDLVKDAEIPMLLIVNQIHPLFSFLYAGVIFALIFNTAFSLYYATAKRFGGNSTKKTRKWMVLLVGAGYLCSFGGFTQLIAWMYPIVGVLGIVLIVVLAVGWEREKQNIILEKLLRRKMIRLMFRKYDDDVIFTEKNQQAFQKLGKLSVADTKDLEQDIQVYAEEIAENHDDLQAYAKKYLPIDQGELKERVAERRQELYGV